VPLPPERRSIRRLWAEKPARCLQARTLAAPRPGAPSLLRRRLIPAMTMTTARMDNAMQTRIVGAALALACALLLPAAARSGAQGDRPAAPAPSVPMVP